jgi:hypothetical protein
MKLELSNVIVRAYKKKNLGIALHLRGHLLGFTNVSFSFCAYLREMQSWITLPGQTEIEARSMSVNVGCTYSEDVMIHGLHAEFMLPYHKLRKSVAHLRMMFHVSFTGHPTEEPTYIERKTVIVLVPDSWTSYGDF